MKRLLIADDDAGMRAALEARFQRRGWQVDVAVNGTEALAKFREGLHSLVITDVRMPGRDGFELMREVQTSSARTAVILLTAYGCVPDAVEAMRNGACDYLVKPVCFEKLELAVEQVLRRAEEFGKDTETLIGHSPLWEQALEFALLQGAEQFRLQGDRHFADLIEQQGASAGRLEFAGPGADGSGEGAAGVAK